MLGSRPGRARTLRAAAARIEWGYARAGDVRQATVTRSAAGAWTAVGRLRDPDAFRLTQRPLMLVVPLVGGARWCWPVQSSTVVADAWSAVLGERIV